MTTILQIFVIIAFIASVIGLKILAEIETRRSGAAKIAPILFYCFIAGAITLFYLDDVMVSDRSEETVRQIFHLPDDIEVGRIHRGDKNPVCYRKSANYFTVVPLTPDQFARYIGSIHDRSVWRPINPPHYLAYKSRLQFADKALAWQELPEPGWTGKQQLVWRVARHDVRRGLALCYTISPVHQQPMTPTETATSIYSVTPCNARARVTIPAGGGRVAAALDFDKQRLALAINFDSKPDYCNNRVSNFLGAALGIDEK